MSMPNIPDIKPKIDLCFDDVVNLLLASIALEELSLAHIMNAEAEKIQEVIKFKCNSLEDLIAIDDSVERTMKVVVQKEMLLENKFDNILELIDKRKYCDCSHIYKKET